MSRFRNPDYEDAYCRGKHDGYGGEAYSQGDKLENRAAYDHGKLDGARQYWRDKATGTVSED